MKLKLTVLLTLSALALGMMPGCSAIVAGSGRLETRDYNLTGFTKVETANGFEVAITESADYSVSVTADDNLFDHIDIRKSGATLHIGLKRGVLATGTTMGASVGMPQIQGLSLSGGSDGRITGFRSALPLNLALSGGSSLVIDDARAGTTRLSLSGASDVSGRLTGTSVTLDLSGASAATLRGSATSLNASGSGASNFHLADFVAKSANVQLSGASNAQVFVTGDLRLTLSGGSHVSYDGDPTLRNVQMSGGSSIKEI